MSPVGEIGQQPSNYLRWGSKARKHIENLWSWDGIKSAAKIHKDRFLYLRAAIKWLRNSMCEEEIIPLHAKWKGFTLCIEAFISVHPLNAERKLIVSIYLPIGKSHLPILVMFGRGLPLKCNLDWLHPPFHRVNFLTSPDDAPAFRTENLWKIIPYPNAALTSSLFWY